MGNSSGTSADVIEREAESARGASERANAAAIKAQAAAAEARAALDQVTSLAVDAQELEKPLGWDWGFLSSMPRSYYECQAKAKRAEVSMNASEAARLAAEARVDALEAARASAVLRMRAAQAETETCQGQKASAERSLRNYKILLSVLVVVCPLVGVLVGGVIGAMAAGASESHLITNHIRSNASAITFEPGAADDTLATAVLDLTLRFFSVVNVLHAVGGTALTGVFVFLLAYMRNQGRAVRQHLRKAELCSAVLSFVYIMVFAWLGDRLSSRDNDGSRLVGGLLQCAAALAAPAASGYLLLAFGSSWNTVLRTLGSTSRMSLADVRGLGLLSAIMFMAAVGFGVTALLYTRSGFPLLVVPMCFMMYAGCMCFCMSVWDYLVTRSRTQVLQPEIIATLVIGLCVFGYANSDAASLYLPSAVRLGLFLTAMNALLAAVPPTLLATVELSLPAVTHTTEQLSLYKPIDFAEHVKTVVRRVRTTPAFAVGATGYSLMWMTLLSRSLQLQMWACWPYPLAAIIILCIVARKHSYWWAIAFHLPIGFWLLSVTMFLEATVPTRSQRSDPMVREVLRWLGPRPEPFLNLLGSSLHAGTFCTAMTCLTTGAVNVQQHFAGSPWAMVWIHWLLSLLLATARQDVHTLLLSILVSIWTCVFFILGVRLLPGWAHGYARPVTFAVASRLCLVGSGNIAIQLIAATFVAGTCLSLVYGESDLMVDIRRAFLHPDATPAPRKAVSFGLLASALLLGYGMLHAEVLIVMLGCFCIYASIASIVVGDDVVSRASVVAACGLVTMLLSEVFQEQLVPFQSALSSMAEKYPVCGLMLNLNGQDGLPLDIWILRDFLRDAGRAVGGGQRL